jgi:outer membrane protein assembly factor BamB
VALCNAAVLSAAAPEVPWVPTGLAEIDAMRRDSVVQPTGKDNALRRQSLVFSWVRLLVHRGVDMADFHVACADISAWGPIAPARYPALDQAIRTLEKIQANPRFTAEVRGTEETTPVRATDWPLFGGNAEQSGFSPDPGPTSGRIDWRFPVGMSWHAAPALEDGRVYIASPGVTTLLYCLDERTGAVVWRTRQDGLQIYSTPRASSTCLVRGDQVILRATSGSWEFSEKVKHILFVDKRTGKISQEIDANRVDYRRGVAPIQSEGDHLVYPWSRLDLRAPPAVVQMQDTVVVRKAAKGEPWWALRVGEMYGEPIIAGDLVLAPTEKGVLHAFHLAGPQRMAWTVDLGAPLRTAVVADAAVVYGVAENGTLFALDRRQGKLRWRVELTAPELRAFHQFSRITLNDGLLFVGAATRRVFCVEAVTGRRRWTAPVSDWVRSRPLVVGDRVFAASLDGKVTALDRREGRPLWSAAASRHPILADLVGNERGVLVSSSDLFLSSLAPADGRRQWRHSLLECIYEKEERILADVVAGGGDYQSPPTVSQGKVFVGGPDRFVRAIEAHSGREVWRFETSGQVSGAVTIQNGRVFFGQQGGGREMYGVNEQDGSPLWRSAVGWVWTTSTPDGDRLYTGTVEGDILALSTADGRVLWRRPTNGGVYPAPAVSGGLVYTGSWDGYYYALDRRDGSIAWCYATEGRDYALGGGPDSAAAILWKGNLICRVVPETLIALHARSGEPVWRFRDPTRARPRSGMNATPSASGDRVFVSTSIDHDGMPCGGRLFCLDDRDGKLVWSYTGAGGWTGSSCTPQTVLCGSSTDVFVSAVAIQPHADGSPRVLWRTRVQGIFQESIPAISGRQAFVLCSDGYLYAFR